MNTDIIYGVGSSPFGLCFMACINDDIFRLAFIEKGIEDFLEEIKNAFPDADVYRNDKKIKQMLEIIFSNKKPKEKIYLQLLGTQFQIKVWETLLSIPFGEVTSYADIAKKCGSPLAVRAVGTACGANPIAFLVPCHRVLTSIGDLGGYKWGLDRKKKILAWEASLC